MTDFLEQLPAEDLEAYKAPVSLVRPVIILRIAAVEKLRRTEVQSLFQGHSVHLWQSQVRT